MIPAILIMISTTVDFYSSQDGNATPWQNRASQIQNPFMFVSLIIVAVCALATFLFFFCVVVWRIVEYCRYERQKMKDLEMSELWQNMEEFQWGQSKLYKKMTDIMKHSTTAFEVEKVSKKEVAESMKNRLKVTMVRKQSRINPQLKATRKKSIQYEHQNLFPSFAF